MAQTTFKDKGEAYEMLAALAFAVLGRSQEFYLERIKNAEKLYAVADGQDYAAGRIIDSIKLHLFIKGQFTMSAARNIDGWKMTTPPMGERSAQYQRDWEKARRTIMDDKAHLLICRDALFAICGYLGYDPALSAPALKLKPAVA